MATNTLWNEEEAVGLLFDPFRNQVLVNSVWGGIAVLDADKDFADIGQVLLGGGKGKHHPLSTLCVGVAAAANTVLYGRFQSIMCRHDLP